MSENPTITLLVEFDWKQGRMWKSGLLQGGLDTKFEIDAWLFQPSEIGFALADGFASAQAAVINHMAAKMETWGHADCEMQQCNIAQNLDEAGIEFIESLHAFIELNKAEAQHD